MNITCSDCGNPASVEIIPGCFLCDACEAVLKYAIQNAAQSLSDRSPAPASAVMPGSIEQAAEANQYELARPVITSSDGRGAGLRSTPGKKDCAPILESCGDAESRSIPSTECLSGLNNRGHLEKGSEWCGRRGEFTAGLAPGPQELHSDLKRGAA